VQRIFQRTAQFWGFGLVKNSKAERKKIVQNIRALC